MMNFLTQLVENKILISAASGWVIAQVLKTILYALLNREFLAERLVGGGGMPSSHSATVCALSTATAMKFGPSSFEFAMAAVFSLVVMYDAIGVRQEAGKQAKVLNDMVEIFLQPAADQRRPFLRVIAIGCQDIFLPGRLQRIRAERIDHIFPKFVVQIGDLHHQGGDLIFLAGEIVDSHTGLVANGLTLVHKPSHLRFDLIAQRHTHTVGKHKFRHMAAVEAAARMGIFDSIPIFHRDAYRFCNSPVDLVRISV